MTFFARTENRSRFSYISLICIILLCNIPVLKTFNLLKNQAAMLPRTTFSVVFFCKKTKVTKKGKAPIYARITTTGQSTEVYTQCQIEPDRWNQRLERSLYKEEVDQQINRIVASYRASIPAAYDRLIQENKTPTCFAVKQLLGSASSSRMLLAEYLRVQRKAATCNLTLSEYARQAVISGRILRRIGTEELRLVSELTRERNNLNQLAFLQHAFGVATHEEELRRILRFYDEMIGRLKQKL